MEYPGTEWEVGNPMQRIEIPVYDPRPEVEFLWEELRAAMERVLASGRYILGPEVQQFEREVAQYLSVKHAIGLNSGTDALVIGLRALGIQPGDEVITSPFTFFATAEAISLIGATPVFVDIDPKTFNINPELITAAITERTKAIVPVHLYGQAADMDPILEIAHKYGLKVLEDTAQGFGAEYKGQKLGTIGDAGAYSFFPTKNLGGMGDGGLLVTNDDSVAQNARKLRAHGASKKYFNEVIGYNSRLDEIQAAFLRVKLKYVDEFNDRRRRLAYTYAQQLEGIESISLPYEAEYGKHVYHQFTIRVKDGMRDDVARHLKENGIQTMVYYPTPVHRLPVYSFPEGTAPEAELASKEVLSLPISPTHTQQFE